MSDSDEITCEEFKEACKALPDSVKEKIFLESMMRSIDEEGVEVIADEIWVVLGQREFSNATRIAALIVAIKCLAVSMPPVTEDLFWKVFPEALKYIRVTKKAEEEVIE